ncbi:MAG: hypothetical protein CVV61_00120 [Tenericutes bacterium HGW-Tenericutes-6]|nr:MAG: hypothetical protein CVV61_00120 [Tenericutes bacterium HGW-Tenericutes-6]
MPIQLISNIFIGLVICWVILNLFWFLLVFLKRFMKINVPKEIEFHIKKTMKINFVYMVVFGLLGFLLI